MTFFENDPYRKHECMLFPTLMFS